MENKFNTKPPSLAEGIIKKIAWSEDAVSIIEDLRDEYNEHLTMEGKLTADWWYVKHMFRSIFPFLKFTFIWSMIMLKNYIKTTLRNMNKYKGYTAIIFTGLVIGIASSVLIFLWVHDEVSYDRFHQKGDNIHRVVSNLWVQPAPLAPTLVKDYPEIENAVRIRYRRTLVSIDPKKFYEDNFSFADNSLFEIFTLPFIKGNPETALSQPLSLVLTQELAEKYFGDKDPMGRSLRIDNAYEMKITGIIKNIPNNSTLRLSLIGSFTTLKHLGIKMNDWGNHIYYTYILLNKDASFAEVSQKIQKVVQLKVPHLSISKGLSLQPFKKIHLYFEDNIKNVTIFSLIAFFILVLAYINFINLTTARSENRSLEVGVRKVIGARRINLIKQFLGESVFISFITFVMAILLVKLLLPAFNNLTGKMLSLSITGDYAMLLYLFGLTLFAGILAGCYPALYLSSFSAHKVIRKINTSGKTRSGRLRELLVVFQFSISVFLIISTIVVYHQLKFLQKKDIGYSKEHIMYLSLNRSILPKRKAFQERVRQLPGILKVTMASSLPTNVSNTATGIDWHGNNGQKKASWRFVTVDYDYFETLKLKMVAGRSFSRELVSESQNGYVVNEEAVKEMGLKNPVGKRFSLWGREGKIIGVVKNFHFLSLHSPISPLMLFMVPDQYGFYEYFLIRMAPNSIKEGLKGIKEIWHNFVPDFPFEYHFLDESFEQQYRAEERMGKISIYFTLLAMFISCLGLLGLAAYTAEQRTKEIGIRRVFGATAVSILGMMTGVYSRWIIIANIIAWPLAYFALNKWLQGFAYRTKISIYSFVLAVVLSLSIAMLTVVFQSIKAAIAKPVDAIRYE
jgi:ABC-type antimicrobial peptide transport system permease subunit